MMGVFFRAIKNGLFTRARREELPDKFGEYDHQVALLMAKFSRLTYPAASCVKQDYRSREEYEADIVDKKRIVGEWGFKHFDYIYSEPKKILVLLARKGQDVVISFRGTVMNNSLNVRIDLQTRLIDTPRCGSVHQGFSDGLDSVWDEIVNHPYLGHKKRRLWLTGHSLGGAMALLSGVRWLDYFAGKDRNLIWGIYTFAAPRVGNLEFESIFKRSYLAQRTFSFVNFNDVITVVPPFVKKISEYTEVGTIIYIDKFGKLVYRDKVIGFDTFRNFLAGYFQEQVFGKLDWGVIIKDWKTFRSFMKQVFSQIKLSQTAGKEEKKNWNRLKRSFAKLSPKGQDSSMVETSLELEAQPKIFKIILELFIDLFVQLHPYVVDSHSIDTYIKRIENSIDNPPSFPTGENTETPSAHSELS